MILQVSTAPLTVRQGWRQIASEGEQGYSLSFVLCCAGQHTLHVIPTPSLHHTCTVAHSVLSHTHCMPPHQTPQAWLHSMHNHVPPPGTLRAYFKGNGANVLKITPETAVKLALNDRFKGVFAKDPTRPRPEERMIAGGLAGAVAQLVCYPLDVVRTRLTVSSLFAVLRNIVLRSLAAQLRHHVLTLPARTFSSQMHTPRHTMSAHTHAHTATPAT